MQHQRPPTSCGRETSVREFALHEAGFDDVETHVLHLVRFFFQSFAMPNTQAWMNGLDLSEQVFGDVEGPSIALRIVDVLRGVRYARRSTFMFNSPTCTCCAAHVTEHEGRLIRAFANVLRGRIGAAQTELMMLCEGNDTTYSIGALVRLSKRVSAPETVTSEVSHV